MHRNKEDALELDNDQAVDIRNTNCEAENNNNILTQQMMMMASPASSLQASEYFSN